MQKITSPDYHLPEIIPLQWVRTLASGANQPIVVRGIEKAGTHSEEYVLKYRGAERMNETSSRRELLAAWIATEMDIHTPAPLLIEVDENFVRTLPQALQTKLSTRAIGLNFGNRYIEGKTIILPNGVAPTELAQAAARIFAFDLLIQNSDRRSEKPNLFVSEGKLYVIDHELAFGFLSMLPIFVNQSPWILTDIDVFAAQQHLFYPILHQRKDFNWEAATSTFKNLTPYFWQRANDLLPEAWQDPAEMTRIQQHFELIQQHSATFFLEIWNKLIG